MRLQHYFTIIAIFVICGCGVNEKDIRRYGREGNVDLLVRTIEKGYEEPKQHEKVKLAINQLVKRKEDKVWNYLLYRFDRGFSDDLIRYTLLAPSSVSDLNTLQKQFLQHIKEANYTEAQTWLSIAGGAGIANEEIPVPVQEQLYLTLNTHSRLDSLTKLQQEAEQSIDYYQDKIESARETKGKYFLLRGYIVGQADNGLYEITYFGSRAYLMTTETRFDSRGQFTIWASELMEVPVTLRQEFGGFTQQWKVYREAPSHEIKGMREAMNRISASEDSIEVRQLTIAHLEPVISSQNEAFKTALNRLNSVLEETFGHSNIGVE